MKNNWREIRVSISGNSTRAYIKVPFMKSESREKESLRIEHALKALKSAGVIRCVDRDMVEKIFEQALFNQQVLVAQGIPPKPGTNARIQYFFKIKEKLEPDENKDGQVDYKEIFTIENVSKGDKLCLRHPPKEGEPGITVTGKIIRPKAGRDIPLPKGPYTEPSPKNSNLLISSIDGHVVLNSDNKVEVKPFLEIKDDVDYSTGNLNFPGSARIRGDIKTGFNIKVKDDLEVNGCVEDAKVEAGGNIIVKKGFIGGGKGVIKAGGNVKVKHVNGQKIICSGNLNVGGELFDSRVVVDGHITVRGQRGAIIGGEIVAGESILAQQIGNDHFVPTKVMSGRIDEHKSKCSKIIETLEELENKQELLQSAVEELNQLKADSEGTLPSDKKSLLHKTLRAKTQLLKRQKVLEKNRRLISDKINKVKNSYILVEESVFPEVEMVIGSSQRLFTIRFEKKIFRESGGTVVMEEADGIII